jgi:DNA integrity scanning protein DisA with diadenylate cyclase activity
VQTLQEMSLGTFCVIKNKSSLKHMNGFGEISLDINVGNFENMFQQVFAK